MSRLLETEGYAVDCCGSGKDALEKAGSRDYCLVLLDIAMPDLDGWETCHRLHENPLLAGIKVCLVTAKPVDRSALRFRESGADGYLLKPFKAEDLLAMVQGFDTPRANRMV
jgi:DNA-binding response OmpR family regulator